MIFMRTVVCTARSKSSNNNAINTLASQKSAPSRITRTVHYKSLPRASCRK